MRGLWMLSVVCAIGLARWAIAQEADERPETAALATAKADYLEARKKARPLLREVIDKAVVEIQKKGNPEEIKTLKLAQENFEESELAPTLSRLKGSAGRYNSVLKPATSRLNGAYEKLIKAHTKRSDTAAADAAGEEWKVFKSGHLPADMQATVLEEELAEAHEDDHQGPGSSPATLAILKRHMTATWGTNAGDSDQPKKIDVTDRVLDQLAKGPAISLARLYDDRPAASELPLEIELRVGQHAFTATMRPRSTLAVRLRKAADKAVPGEPIRDSEFELLSATYGLEGNAIREDVLERYSQVFRGSAFADVSTQHFGEPAPGKVKSLETGWRVRNLILDLHMTDDSTVTIAPRN